VSGCDAWVVDSCFVFVFGLSSFWVLDADVDMGASVWIQVKLGGLFGFTSGGVRVWYEGSVDDKVYLHGHSQLGGCASENCICRIAITLSRYISIAIHLIFSPTGNDSPVATSSPLRVVPSRVPYPLPKATYKLTRTYISSRSSNDPSCRASYRRRIQAWQTEP